MVELLITIGSAPFEKTMILDFVVIDEESSYEVILGCPFLKVRKAILFDHYLDLKYRVNGVVGTVRGGQRITRDYNSTVANEVMQITSFDGRV